MKRTLVLVCALVAGSTVMAQEGDGSRSASGVDLLDGLWQMVDATPLPTGDVDLRLGYRWVTASDEANRGDSDDDSIVTPMIVWGACDNAQVSISVPVWLGDQGDIPGNPDGNADTNIGIVWRIADQQDIWPSVALGGNLRLPTGDRSNGVDAELRLILTNEYDSDLRSHINAFAESANGDNAEDQRHFQWGVVIGMDGPLCAGGAVRWVADYMHRSSEFDGTSNMNILELGWQWSMSDAESLGFAVQIGLDDNEETPNVGAGIMYSVSLGS